MDKLSKHHRDAAAMNAEAKPVDNPVPDRDVLAEARRLTSGDRSCQYGPPEQDFSRTAAMWSAYLGSEVRPHDVAWMMVMLKASRNTHQRKRDNYVDAIGYLRCGAGIEGFDDWIARQ